MDKNIKSGKEIIDGFFKEIYTIKNIDKDTVDVLVSLFNKDKLSDKNIQNALDELVQNNLDRIDQENE